MNHKTKTVSLGEAATQGKQYGRPIDTTTLRAMCESGAIQGASVGGKSRWRIPYAALRRYLITGNFNE